MAQANAQTKGTPTASPSTRVLQYRVATGNMAKNGGQKGSLTRCAQRLGELSVQRNEDARRTLVNELRLYRLEVSKQFLRYGTMRQEIQRLDRSRDKSPRKQLERQTEEAAQRADRAKRQRTCYIEYNALAKLALNQNSDRAKLEADVAEMEKELEERQADAVKLDRVLKKRERQFQLLLQYMMDLKKNIREEEEEDRQLRK